MGVLDTRWGLVLLNYSGIDEQLWFWDGRSIRSKKYPDHLLDLDHRDVTDNECGRVLLYPQFHGYEYQRWKVEGDEIISQFRNLRLDVKRSRDGIGALVGCYKRNGGLNQKWSLRYVNEVQEPANVLDIPNPHELVQEIPENRGTPNNCLVCLNQTQNTYAMVPCGHAFLCDDCSRNILMDVGGFGKICPLCRRRANGRFKIFCN